MQLEGGEPFINALLRLLEYPIQLHEIEQFWLEHVTGYPTGWNHPNVVNLSSLSKSACGTTQIVWIYECLARVCGTKSWERYSVYFIK
jgi:hypothetical protein